MKKIKCLVVDDEELARTLLSTYIKKVPHLELLAQCSNPLQAAEKLMRHNIDILFLDIQMPVMTGIEFLKTLKKRPLIVFTTAYSEYSLEGYDLDVLDYLLKPFSFQRFVQTINKAQERLSFVTPNTDIIAADNEAIKDYILVKSEHKIHRMFYKDILYIQSMREYVAFYTATGKILSLGSLKSLETSLPKHLFIRVHKSYIVSKNKVNTLEGNSLHIGNEKIAIGAIYKEKVLSDLF